MDYGYFNQFLDREVAEPFWGTRTEHIVRVAACLAVTDHASQSIFGKMLGEPLSFATSPAAFVAHTFLFIFAGVTLYVAGDAALTRLTRDVVSKKQRVERTVRILEATRLGLNPM